MGAVFFIIQVGARPIPAIDLADVACITAQMRVNTGDKANSKLVVALPEKNPVELRP